MKTFNIALATIVMIAALAAPTAFAHLANPAYHSEIEALPQSGITEGVEISMAPGSDHVRLDNDSGKIVTVLGTEGEPYIRILANGDVQVNENSVTFKDDEAAEAADDKPTAGESGKSGPDWQTVDDVEKGAYEWRDSRIRYLGEGVPPQVTDQSEGTLIKDYEIPLVIDRQTIEAKGELFWKGDESGSSTLPFIGLGILALLAMAGAVVLKKRRTD